MGSSFDLLSFVNFPRLDLCVALATNNNASRLWVSLTNVRWVANMSKTLKPFRCPKMFQLASQKKYGNESVYV